METRARHVLIGLFTVLATVLALLFTLWLTQQSERDFHFYDIAFEEAVTGLSRGSTVEFNGIKVGDVIDLRINPKDPRNVYARVRVESTAPVRTDTKARLVPVSLSIEKRGSISINSGEPWFQIPFASELPPKNTGASA